MSDFLVALLSFVASCAVLFVAKKGGVIGWFFDRYKDLVDKEITDCAVLKEDADSTLKELRCEYDKQMELIDSAIDLARKEAEAYVEQRKSAAQRIARMRLDASSVQLEREKKDALYALEKSLVLRIASDVNSSMQSSIDDLSGSLSAADFDKIMQDVRTKIH